MLGEMIDDGFSIRAPMFPLNTDGIDPHGKNILIERVNITNYDDAVAVKPVYNNATRVDCSENIMVRDVIVHFSVGLSIGSVPPANEYACIRNVTIKDSVLYYPIKAIYIKTNSGWTDSMLPGSGGEITNIHYDNIEIHNPLWWGIYIGPQQQKEPDGSGDGCMTYPIGGCATQPLIKMANVTLSNIRQYGSILPPGIVRCNETAVCTGFVFDNVKSHGFWSMLGINYITENIIGTVKDSRPAPQFGTGNVLTENGLLNDFSSRFSHKLRELIAEFFSKIHIHKRHHRHDQEEPEEEHHHGRHHEDRGHRRHADPYWEADHPHHGRHHW